MFNFILSPEEHQKWVNELIIPTFTTDKKTSNTPTFILLTGQSGAGKSYSSLRYAQENLTEAPVRFGTDDIRALHPHAAKILQEDRANYAFKTKKDAGKARSMLFDYCFQNKYNILIESILLSPDDYKMQTLIQARENGYRIECVALGVHRNISEVSMYTRQEEQIKLSGVGFPATLEVHNEAYELLPEILSKMNDFKTVDKISIYNRKHECFYDSDKDIKNSIVIRDQLMRSRNSSLNNLEMTEIALKWENVINMMHKRSAPQREIEEVKELYGNFVKKTGLLLFPEFIKFRQQQKAK